LLANLGGKFTFRAPDWASFPDVEQQSIIFIWSDYLVHDFIDSQEVRLFEVSWVFVLAEPADLLGAAIVPDYH
jgi:hypothetical protein